MVTLVFSVIADIDRICEKGKQMELRYIGLSVPSNPPLVYVGHTVIVLFI